jgi:hypothetical protein
MLEGAGDHGEVLVAEPLFHRPLPLRGEAVGHGEPVDVDFTGELAFQAAKSQVGLDQHQVRRWDSWHRFTALAALAALAVLAVCASEAATGEAGNDPGHTRQIKLTVNEVRRLINTFIIRPISDLAHRLHWSL